MIRNSHKDWGIAGWIRQAAVASSPYRSHTGVESSHSLDVLDRSVDPEIVDASSQVRNELVTRGFVRQLQPGQPQDL
jgi:hypothetical protein